MTFLMQQVHSSRREFLRVGGAALVIGAGLNAFSEFPLIQQLQAGTLGKCRSVIYLWACGGLSSLDSFDPKETNNNLTMLFKRKPSSMDGVDTTEMFPKIGGVLKHGVLFRARIGHKNLCHLSSIADSLDRRTDGTHLLTNIARASSKRFVYAEAPNVINGFNYRQGSFSTQLSDEALWDSHAKQYQEPAGAVPDPRIDDKASLLRALEKESKFAVSNDATNKYDAEREEAIRLVQQCKEVAGRLDPKDIQDYTQGQVTPMTMGPLMAREIIRKGVAGALLIRLGYSQKYGGWDHHVDAYHCVKEMASPFDHAVSCLIRDWLKGMLKDTVVVIDTEFGRTRGLNSEHGRDHFPWHTSIIFGDDFEPGTVVGATDRNGLGPPSGGMEKGVFSNEDFNRLLLHGVQYRRDIEGRLKFPSGILKTMIK
jgi:hypothetical protein